jgi:hypothetical protein
MAKKFAMREYIRQAAPLSSSSDGDQGTADASTAYDPNAQRCLAVRT